MRPMSKKIWWKSVFSSRRVWHFFFANFLIEELFPTLYLVLWRLNNFIFRQRKSIIIRESKVSKNEQIVRLIWASCIIMTEDNTQSYLLPGWNWKKRNYFFLKLSSIISHFEIATLRSKRKLASVARENQEVYPKPSQSRSTVISRFNDDYITQLPEETECGVT